MLITLELLVSVQNGDEASSSIRLAVRPLNNMVYFDRILLIFEKKK